MQTAEMIEQAKNTLTVLSKTQAGKMAFGLARRHPIVGVLAVVSFGIYAWRHGMFGAGRPAMVRAH
jgi:hypothetical protein